LPAHFAELSTIRAGQNQCRRSKAWKMHRGLTVLMMNSGDLYVGLGVDGTKSKEEHINLVETIKGLQKYVQSYKVDNERLMKAKEQQDDFNVKLMQSLDIIEKKMDKETETSRSRSHRSHDEKRREARSVDRHHPHSPKHSFRKAHSSSSPSPVRKHKRRTGVDELQGEMNKIKPPTFDGEHKKDEDAETWLLGMRKYFQLHNYSAQAEGRISIYQLKGKASMWWDQFVQVQHIDEKKVTWREFKRYFQKKYLTKRYYDKKMKEFFELKLGSMTIDEYERRFLELVEICRIHQG
jgi:hypothetical protein